MRKLLPPEEWRMHKDCPSDELEICWWYEYAREAIRELPVEGPLFPLDPFLTESFSSPDLFPEWPDKPYLLILGSEPGSEPGSERAKRLQRLAGGARNYLRSLSLMPPFLSCFTPETAKKYLDGFGVFEVSLGERKLRLPKHGRVKVPRGVKIKECKLRLRHRWPISEISDRAWVALFKINWEHSDQELLSEYAEWLKVHRPKAFPSKVRLSTGMASVLPQLRTDLKALGALRLLRHYEHYTKIPGEAGKLYSAQANWIKARGRAEICLGLFDLDPAKVKNSRELRGLASRIKGQK